MELDNNRKVEIIIGLFLLGGIITWLVIPMSFQDTTIILESGNSGGNSTGAVTSVNATSPIVSSGGTTPNISCPTCITDISGYELWEFLNSTSPSDGATSFTISFTAEKYLKVVVYEKGDSTVTTAGNMRIRFNGDTGNNYNYYFNNRDSVSQANNQPSCLTQSFDENWQYYGTMNIYNVASGNKISYTEIMSDTQSSVNGAGFFYSYCGWANTSDQITNITFFRDTGTWAFDSTTLIQVYGHD